MEQVPFQHTITTSSRSISEQAKRVVTNEKHKVSRILYCGPNYSGKGLILFRVLEIGNGCHFLEKVNFNYDEKSVESKVMKLQGMVFHKYLDPHKEDYNLRYKTSQDVFSGVSLYRQLETGNGHLRSHMMVQSRNMYDFFTYWRLRNYFKK